MFLSRIPLPWGSTYLEEGGIYEGRPNITCLAASPVDANVVVSGHGWGTATVLMLKEGSQCS